MRLTEVELKQVEERVGEALREIALLWFTFSLLDRFVVGTLTFHWAIGNGGGAIAAWAVGLYIETRRSR